jgi:thiamine-monophosphate kinase
MSNNFALGEFALIARLTRGLRATSDQLLGIGDDCAILDLHAPTLLLATSDSQVEGVHFTLTTSTPEQIGRKALAVNLSDIAAMGGEPRYALVSLILPPTLPLATLDSIYAGLRRQADDFATTIVGGNISGSGSSETLIIDITLLGTIERGHALLRSGAQPGDTICVTGTIGDSAAGLFTLLHPHQSLPSTDVAFVRSRCRTPQPRIPEGRVLSQLGPAIITAMLDISDGLSGDLTHLCERSHVGARIHHAQIPLSPAIQTIAQHSEQDALEWALHGGEDFELLFTVSPGHEHQVINAVREATGTQVTAIGTILPQNEGIHQVFTDGRDAPLAVRSWDHLKPG